MNDGDMAATDAGLNNNPIDIEDWLWAAMTNCKMAVQMSVLFPVDYAQKVTPSTSGRGDN